MRDWTGVCPQVTLGPTFSWRRNSCAYIGWFESFKSQRNRHIAVTTLRSGGVREKVGTMAPPPNVLASSNLALVPTIILSYNCHPPHLLAPTDRIFVTRLLNFGNSGPESTQRVKSQNSTCYSHTG